MPKQPDYFELEPLLAEIERNQIDSGKLYVALDSLLDLEVEEAIPDGWSLPNLSLPGEWREAEISKIDLITKSEISRLIRLYTLSGLLLFGFLKAKLFLAEYEGASLEIHSGVVPESADPSLPYFRGMRKGVRVAKARLLREEEYWNKFNIYNFACDCAERAISRNEILYNHSDEINQDGLKFVRASGKFIHLKNPSDVEQIFGKSFTNHEERWESYDSKKDSLRTQIEEKAKLDLASKSLLACFDGIYSPFIAANKASLHARVNHALTSSLELKSKGYKVPKRNPELENEREVANRIWYMYQKKELDWQVLHLENILNK